MQQTSPASASTHESSSVTDYGSGAAATRNPRPIAACPASRAVTRVPALVSILVMALAVPTAYAQEATADTAPDALETIVVTATRTERDIADVPATISLIDAEQIERQIARDIADLVRYEPGVSVGGTGDRFGLGGYTIRGIGGNRVLTMIDGIRLADQYSFGPFLNASRDYVDVDALKAVEIVRGPGSALYGSDALGGVVAYRSKEAPDYLGGEPFYGGIKLGYSGVNDGAVGTVTLAGGGDLVDGLLRYTQREGHETENHGGAGGTGPGRTLPDPLDHDSDDTALRLSLNPADAHRLTLGADLYDGTTTTQVLSNYDTVVRDVLTQMQDAEDAIERERLSLEYRYTPVGDAIDRLTVLAYRQDSSQAQHTREARMALADGSTTNRARDSFFDQDIDGLQAQLNKRFAFTGHGHYFVVGGEFWQTDSAMLRDGGTTDAATGAPIPEFEPLPTRNFPLTSIDQSALYVQDEIGLLDGRLALVPSLRYDSFDATATGDAIYFTGNPGTPVPADYEDSEISPKLGLLYDFTETVSLYAQYAEGFKAPPYGDVNVGFSNPVGGYKTISNPDLESERSKGAELGLRFRLPTGRLSVVAFENEYDNFIAQFLPAPQFPGGIDPVDGLLAFQSQNLEGVEIDGFEVSGRVGLGRVGLGRASAFALDFAFAYADGESTADGTPLNDIDPPEAVLGLNYAAASGRFGGDVVFTFVDSKDASDIDPGNPRYATDSYLLVDVLGYYDAGEHVRLNFGLFNVGDEEYIRWADTAAFALDPASGTFPESARFTQPGFNAGMTVRVEF